MSKKIIIGLTIAVVIGIGTYAFGHRSESYGYHSRMQGRPGKHHGYYSESGYDYPGNLNDEEIKALDEERSAFFKETENIRRNLYSKRLELRRKIIKIRTPLRQRLHRKRYPNLSLILTGSE